MTDAVTDMAPAAPVRTRTRRKIALVGALLLLVCAAVTVVLLMRGADAQLAAAARDYEMRESARELLLDLASAEAAQRGFLLTRDDGYLPEFTAASARIETSYRTLMEFLVEDQAVRSDVAALGAPLATQQAAMQEGVALGESGRWFEAAALVGAPEAREAGQQVVAGLEDLIGRQDAELVLRNQSMDRTRFWMVGAILLALGSAGLLAFFLFTRSQRQLAELVGLRGRLQSENETLEQRVRRRTSEAEEARAHAERERARVETLLQDTNHRIGNSLATVSSLLALQVGRSRSDAVREALEAAQGRVHAIASAHRRLRLGTDMETANAGEFLQAVIEDLHSTQASTGRVRFVTDFIALVISARDATTLGILVGELVTNALKHAFAGRDGGTLWVRLFRDDAGTVCLCVEDDGRGLDSEQPRSETGLGSMIVKQLARQFDGAPSYSPRDGGGTNVCVSMPALGARSGQTDTGNS